MFCGIIKKFQHTMIKAGCETQHASLSTFFLSSF